MELQWQSRLGRHGPRDTRSTEMAKTDRVNTVHRDMKLMLKKWPGFQVLRNSSRFVHWRGSLQPLCQVYIVEILHRNRRQRTGTRSSIPRVTVVDPVLHRRDEEPNKPIPHHYLNKQDPEFPFLCLFDPDADEWDPSMPIATTIVPWTIDWLACYEGWLATGEWTGGGREHSA